MQTMNLPQKRGAYVTMPSGFVKHHRREIVLPLITSKKTYYSPQHPRSHRRALNSGDRMTVAQFASQEQQAEIRLLQEVHLVSLGSLQREYLLVLALAPAGPLPPLMPRRLKSIPTTVEGRKSLQKTNSRQKLIHRILLLGNSLISGVSPSMHLPGLSLQWDNDNLPGLPISPKSVSSNVNRGRSKF